MSLAVLARKSRSTNPRYNNSRGCFRLNMTNRGKLRTCIDGYNTDCKSCEVNNRKPKASKQSSYHNFQRKIKMNIKNCNECCFMGTVYGGRSRNYTKVWADLSACKVEEVYRNSSDIILKRKNEALNNFSNPPLECKYEWGNPTPNKKGECIYYKDISCNPCCYKGDRIKNRVYTNRVAFKREDNGEVKSLTDLENLKNTQSDRIAKLNAKTMKAFKYKFCKDIKDRQDDPRYENIYNNTLTDCNKIIDSMCPE